VRLDLLTVDGQAILRDLQPESDPPCPELSNRIELAHAYIEMEIYTAALTSRQTCELEKVIRLGDGQYIRADAVVGGELLFEVEQTARLADVPRIQDKLTRLAAFYRSPAAQGFSAVVRVLFNLPAEDRNRSLEVWQGVLGNLDVPYRLFACPVLKFLAAPEWENLNGFERLEPKREPVHALPAQAAETSLLAPVDVLPAFLQQQVIRLPEVNTILKAMEAVYAPLAAAWSGGRRDAIFFDTIRTIYEASHYDGGPVQERAEVPVLSQLLLYRYLHMQQNAELLLDMRRACQDTQRGLFHGVNLFRDAYTRLCWTFLRRHGFGPGGPLGVRVIVPSFQDERSDVHVEVMFESGRFVIGEDDLLTIGEARRTEDALAWVLDALWVYREELGLKPKQKQKGE
jgi:hypothetical protein